METHDDSAAGDEELSDDDPVDRLLRDLLQESGPDRMALEELWARHPEHSARLRRRFELLEAAGMLDSPAAPAAGRLPREFGEYTLIRSLGRGGMGEVFLAEQRRLDRRVAIKLAKDELLLSARARERFRREARALSNLEHAGICPIYDVGEVDGIPYLAMRYLEGQTLGEWIVARCAARGESSSGARREDVRAVTEWIEQVARALHAAHESGFLHRDVKPGNVMITRESEAVLLDFGLVRDESTAGQSLTATGDRLGTPAYMSPEQIDDGSGPVDRRTDVYSLGATMYEALTLEPPFTADSRERLYRSILTRSPRDPSRLQSAVTRDLALVVDKAMAKDRRDRYETALELADDLRRAREFLPIRARPAGPLLRLRRWSQRNPLAASLLAVLSLGLGVMVVLTLQLVAQNRTSTARLAAVEASRAFDADEEVGLRKSLEAVELEELPDNVSQLHSAVAQYHLVQKIMTGTYRSGILQQVSPDGLQLVIPETEGKARLWTWESGVWQPGPVVEHGLVPGWLNTTFFPHKDWFVTSGQVSPADGGFQGRARIWRADGTEVGEPLVSEEQSVDFAAIAPDEQSLVTGSRDGVARIWRWNGSGFARRAGDRAMMHDGWAIVGAYSPGGERIVTGEGTRHYLPDTQTSHKVHLWDAEGNHLDSHEQHTDSVSTVAFHPTLPIVLSASHDWTAVLWNTKENTFVRLQHSGGLTLARFSADGEQVLTAAYDGTAKLWDLDGTLLQTFPHEGLLYDASLSDAGHRVLTASDDMTARVFGLDGRVDAILRGHSWVVSAGHLHGDGVHATTIGGDRTIRAWRLSWPDVPAFVGGRGQVTDLHCLADGTIVAANQDYTLRWFDPTGNELGVVDDPPFPRPITYVASASDGRWVAIGRGGSEWTGDLGGPARKIPLEDWTKCVAWTPDGTRFVFGNADCELLLVEPDGTRVGERIGEPKSGQSLVYQVEFAPDGRSLIAAKWDGVLAVHDFDGERVSPSPRRTFEFDVTVRWAAFHPNGRLVLALLPDEGTFRIVDIETGLEVLRKATDSHPVRAAFSPRGDRFVTVSPDSAQLWRTDGTEVAVLREPDARVLCATFTPDGRFVLTGGSNGRIRRWFVYTEDLKAAARERLRNLASSSHEAGK